MYDIIYGNGDSYASGQDLVEHLYFPEKKLYSFDEWKPVQRKNVDRAMKWSRENPKIDVKSLEKQECYISKLGKLTNTPVLNNAVSGAGFQKITMTALDDLLELKEKHNKILCVISFTSAQRLWFPGETGHTNKSDTIVLGGFTDFKDKLSHKVMKRFVMNTSYMDWALQMAASYLGIIKFCEYFDIDVTFIGTPLMNKHHFQEFINNGHGSLVEPFIDYYGGTLGGDTIWDAVRDHTKKVFSAGGHLPVEHHDQIAVELKEKFWT